MHTKDKLALALTKAGLPEMAAKAAEGLYHDFLSPLDLPAMQLLDDLGKAGTPEAMVLRMCAINGDFDASIEESDEWAKSAEGQETLRRIVR